MSTNKPTETGTDVPSGWTVTPAGYIVPEDLDDDPALWTGEKPEHARFDIVGWHDARAMHAANGPFQWPCPSRWNGYECTLPDGHTGTHAAAADMSGRVIAEWAAVR